MKIAVIGNCQVSVLRPILRAIHSNLETPNFPAVQDLNDTHRERVERECREADWIFSQRVNDEYPVEYVRTCYLREHYKEKLVTYPSSYFLGYAPEWNLLRSAEYHDYNCGPLRALHSSKILYAFFKAYRVQEVIDFVEQATEFDVRHYQGFAQKSLDQLRLREDHLDVIISDYIESHFCGSRLFHTMNHPNLEVLGKVAMRLLATIGERYKYAHPDFFGNVDLLSVWHMDNAYLREENEFSFPRIVCYRGAQMITDNAAKTGFRPGEPMLYSSLEVIEAFYAYYSNNKESLRQHPHVQRILEDYSHSK